MTDFGGNSFEQATNLGTDADHYFSDYAGTDDQNDYYKFTISQRSSVRIDMTNLNADIDVRLMNANQSILASSTRGGSNSELINVTLDAGTYYIHVYPWGSASSQYTLSLDVAALVPPDRAGNTFGEARDIGALNGSATFSDFVSANGDRFDYYRFNITQTSNVSLLLSDLIANPDVYLYDSQGNWITGSWNTGTQSESINRQLNAGTYTVLVYGNTGETNYNLRFQADAVTTPPAQVTVQGSAISSTEIQITWNDVGNEDGYRVWQWNGSWQVIATVGRNTTSHIVRGLQASATNYFVVESFNTSGQAFSQYVAVSTPARSTLSITVDWWGGAYTTNNGFRNRGYAPGQFGGWHLGSAAGNCTWYVEGRLRQTAGVTGINTSRLNGLTGHAKDWESRTAIFRMTSTPQVGAVAQWESGGYGHVAFVEQVNADGSIVISESSYVSNNPGNNPANFLYRTRTIRPGGSGGILGGNWPTRFLVVLA